MTTNDSVIFISYPDNCDPVEGIVARNKLTCIEYELPILRECANWLEVSLTVLPDGDYVVYYDNGFQLVDALYGDLKYFSPCP